MNNQEVLKKANQLTGRAAQTASVNKLSERYNEIPPVKDNVVFKLSNGQRMTYNEITGCFLFNSKHKPTLYTQEEASEVRRKLLVDSINEYQRSGKNYQEIHFSSNNKLK